MVMVYLPYEIVNYIIMFRQRHPLLNRMNYLNELFWECNKREYFYFKEYFAFLYVKKEIHLRKK
jgi:hypothetical protein